MRQILTQQQYLSMTGEEISKFQLDRYTMQFEGRIEPNCWLLDDWMLNNDDYPYEVKMALVIYIDFMVTNYQVLNRIPNGGTTVGSTSVDNINTVGSQFGNIRFRLPQSVIEVLKPTNLLSVHAFRGRLSGVKLRGTVYEESPIPIGNVDTTSASSGTVTQQVSQLHDMDELLDTMPSLPMTLSKRSYKMDGNVRTNEQIYTPYAKVVGWFRDNSYTTNDRSTIIITPRDENGETVRLTVGDSVTYTVDGFDETLTIAGFDRHLDYDARTHHYLIYVE